MAMEGKKDADDDAGPAYVSVMTTEADTVGLLGASDGIEEVTVSGTSGGVAELFPAMDAVREHRDTIWRNIYVLMSTFVFALLMVAYASGDLSAFVEKTNPMLMKAHAHCNVGESMPDFLTHDGAISAHALGEVKKLNKVLYGVIFGTMAFMFVLGTFLLWMFQRHGRFMTWTVLTGYLMLITVSTIGFFADGQISLGIVCTILLMIGLTFVSTQRGREKVELVAKLLKAAGKALAQNPHIFTVTIALMFAQIVFFSFILLGSAGFMYHGRLEPNKDPTLTFIGADAPIDSVKSQCYITSEDGKEYYAPCCAWQRESWTTPFLVITYLFALWSYSLCVEIRTYITGGVVTRWYLSDTVSDFKGTTISATKNAFGPSFGSLCFGSLVTTIVNRIRAICGPEEHRTMIGNLLSPFLIWVDEWTLFFTKYTTIRCALSGERFYDAGMAVYRLVSNNLFSAFGIWLFPARLLVTLSFMFTILWSIIMVAACSKTLRHVDWDAIKTVRGLEVYDETFGKVAVALYALICGFGVLSFMLNVLCKAMDACFLCFMMDKEHNCVSKKQLYSVFEEMKETERRRKEARTNQIASMTAIELPERSDRVVTQPGVSTPQYGKPDESSQL